MSQPIRFILNKNEVETDLSPGMAALDFLRIHRKIRGTKEGCREGECGACTVLLGKRMDKKVAYKAVPACLLPLGEIHGKHLVTIEGLNQDSLNPIQQAIVEETATQCGFCTPGIVLSLVGFFLNSPNLDYREAVDALDGNICRCTGYASLLRVAKKMASQYNPKPDFAGDRLAQLIDWKIIPRYFAKIPQKLKQIQKSPEKRTRIKNTATVMAGGTDLYIQKPNRIEDAALFFISRYPEFNRIEVQHGTVRIGAGVTIEALKESEVLNKLFPNLKYDLNLIASTIIRNRATIGGNIVNASPIGDLSIFLLALDASLVISNRQKRRHVRLKDFFKDYKKIDLNKNELIEWVQFKIFPEATHFNFEKVSKRRHLDIASVNSAVSMIIKDNIIQEAHLSAGGIAPIPRYLAKTTSYLTQRAINPSTVKEAVKTAQREISPISDVRGTAAYKRLLLRQLIYAHFIECFPDRIQFEELL